MDQIAAGENALEILGDMKRSPINIFLVQHVPCPFLRNDLPTYLMHDQPTTCPMCGCRSLWIGEDPQLHTCNCGFQFFVEEDEDFGMVEGDGKWISEIEAMSETV